MAKIDPRLVDLLKQYGEDNTSVWDCHGTWVALHDAVERMAARAGIQFDMPTMIVNDPEKKNVVVCVAASLKDRKEWSFGEVSPANNKNAYPYAMAEKRAKDRVALKLLGMSGLVYSEEEADDFKAEKPQKQVNDAPVEQAKSSAQLKREGAWETVTGEISNAMLDIHTFGQFEQLKSDFRERARAEKWNATFLAALKDFLAGCEKELEEKIEKENQEAA